MSENDVKIPKHKRRAKTKLELRIKGYEEVPDNLKHGFTKPGSLRIRG